MHDPILCALVDAKSHVREPQQVKHLRRLGRREFESSRSAAAQQLHEATQRDAIMMWK